MSEDPFPDISQAGTRSILVVDDTTAVRHAVSRLLSHSGFRIFEAASAIEALEVLETARTPISLGLVDVVMPDMNGVELVRIIRERWPRLPVLFMSAFQGEVLVREGLGDPSVIFLAKPFTREELLEKISYALRTTPGRNRENSDADRQ
jgi:two-component system, cell cycle sensor histidine kinase and response regulator CckA